MGRKTYVSFKTEDMAYKDAIKEIEGFDYVDKSLSDPINSTDEDYIMRRIRSDYLYDSTVTIFLIGERSSQNLGDYEQRFIKRELQASLYTSADHSKNGILGIVLPSMYQRVFGGKFDCPTCGEQHNLVSINDDSVISEFSYNYYIPNGKCFHAEDDRYCVLVRWDDFVAAPEGYIEQAFEKRSAPISSKVKVRP
ncbi:MAG TPA: TIR domain-containing protein [Lacisediminihabitans sp.]|uniref:TIR domain-containing protein n=1 Tax=Lacisediminihabitans sp. TaxID=2787631 RepID=UPI002EDB1514